MQISTIEIVIMKHLVRRFGDRTLLMRRAIASLGMVSAITPTAIAILPHRIASGDSFGDRVLKCFPTP